MMPRCGCRFIGKRSGTEYGNAKGPLSLEGAEIAANLLRPRAVHRYLRPDIEADIHTGARPRRRLCPPSVGMERITLFFKCCLS